MTYSTLLQKDSVKQRYLAVMEPRRRVSTWTVVSGFIYKASFSGFNKPTLLEFDGETMTEVFVNTPSASEWYYDETTQEIYFRTPQSADPDTGYAVATYPIYTATFDSYWYSTPTNSSTSIVYFEPIIKKSPEIQATASDALFGYIPVQSSSLRLINTEHWAEKHIYDGSFNKASVMIYHVLDGPDIELSNVRLVYNGVMSDVKYTDDEVTIETVDRIDEFETEYRNLDESFFSTTLFPNLDPNFIGNPIRYVYGYVKGFQPVNIDYVNENPTTSDNRDYVVIGEQTGLNEISRTIGGGTHTTTRTYVSFAEGIQVDDTVWLDRASGVDEYVIVTNISYSPAYIEHAAIASPMTNGDLVKKGFVSRVEIIKDSTLYVAKYGRDYTIGNFTGGTRGFSFSTSLEANLGMGSNLTPGTDKVSCYVYGRVNDLTAGGPTFGANDPITNNLSNPVMILYDLMRRFNIPESRINLTEFASVRTAISSIGFGLVIPSNAGDGFPNYKTILIDLLKSALIRLFIDNDTKWSIGQIAPLTSVDFTVDEQEILESFSYSFDYGDVVSDILIKYARREISDSPAQLSESFSFVTSTNNTARYVHGVEKQDTYTSLHFRETDAQEFSDRLAFILGERRGLLKLTTKQKLFQTLLNDVIDVQRTGIPGESYIDGTLQSRQGAILETSKSLQSVDITVDDQKGIEDNTGSW